MFSDSSTKQRMQRLCYSGWVQRCSKHLRIYQQWKFIREEQKKWRGWEGKMRGEPGFPGKRDFLSLFPEPPGRDKYNYEPCMTPYKIREEVAGWPSLPGLEPGTSGLEVQRARPLRHRDLTAHTASAPELKKHIPSTSRSHLTILLSQQWGDRDSWKIWSGDPPAGSIKAFLNAVGFGSPQRIGGMWWWSLSKSYNLWWNKTDLETLLSFPLHT